MDAREFILQWQAAGSIDELIETTGMKYGTLQSRAAYYRRKGVELKPMLRTGATKRTGKGDWKGLRELARELAALGSAKANDRAIGPRSITADDL
jgi:hypothetical protein